ncbi:hypothetical protein EMPS_05171 [Entomortierella parvispora]|uniref:Uncharacterized protein n=1 Tax=Entomortierella parvispora TaxID=205924 RepID=A0A9P3HAI9_9FUNG|nr:hypothetical protein EMPS_05171 [Entomortierella parvispora]
MQLRPRSMPTLVWQSCLSLLAAMSLVQAQLTVPPTSATEVPPTTITTTTAAIIITTTTTTTTTNSPPPTIPVTPTVSTTTSAFVSIPTTAPPFTSSFVTSTGATTTSTTTAPPLPTTGGKESSSNNVPVIVGAAVGGVAVIIIFATTIICFRRRRRNNRDLTFDTLQGISTSGAASRQRPDQRYNQNVAPVVYDDDYDYDVAEAHHGHVPGGYGAAGGHQGYDNGYDAFGAPLPSTYQNPSIFQEDSLAYSTAVAPIGGRGGGRGGAEALPEITYRNGNDLNHPSGGATGYYEDDYSHQAGGWNQGSGYIGPKGLWIANPTAEGQYSPQPKSQDMELQQQGFVAPPPVSRGSYEKNSINQYDASSEVAGGSPSRPKFRGNNPQSLPESPRLRQLRSGDLFGQDAESGAAASSAAGSPQDATTRNASGTPPLTSSPRSMNRGELRSIELARHSPGRSSGDGAVGHSYADDLPAGRGSLAQDRPSLDSNHSSTPNQSKSLRTLRREDWG